MKHPVPITGFERNAHLTYPHANGFLAGGLGLALARREPETGLDVLTRLDTATGAEHRLAEQPANPDDAFWFDACGGTGRIAWTDGRAIRALDAAAATAPRIVYQETDTSARIDALLSVRPDGRRMLFIRHLPERREIRELDFDTGAARTLVAKPWWIGHAHYSPHDPEWIGFCHEGPTEKIPDRVWAWHARHAPDGACLFDHGAARLCLGHENWTWRDASTLVVAYGVSPRGIYELFADGRPARLVSEGDRDWHVSASRDGRWAVADTTGPRDEPGRGWDNAGMTSDIVLIDLADGARTPLARTRRGARHPLHPHPVFSPDGRAIYYNEADEAGNACRVMRVENPLASLR